MSYQQPNRDLKGIKWGVWILVFVFVGIPLLTVLCCCGGPTILSMFGIAIDGANASSP